MSAKTKRLRAELSETQDAVGDLSWDLTKTEVERDELKATLEFLYSRQVHDGPGLRLDGQRCRGRSADALAWYGAGVRDEPHRDEYPLDRSDLAACERTVEMAPAPIAERMKPVLARYAAALDAAESHGGSR